MFDKNEGKKQADAIYEAVKAHCDVDFWHQEWTGINVYDAWHNAVLDALGYGWVEVDPSDIIAYAFSLDDSIIVAIDGFVPILAQEFAERYENKR